MTWDSNTGKLYWATGCLIKPSLDLVEIDPVTRDFTHVCSLPTTFGGLYVVSETRSQFEPVDHADLVQLSHDILALHPAETSQLTAFVYPWNATDRTVSWASSDETVATVSSDGTVTALAEGTCTITATSNRNPDLSASCTVTVTP